jgi:DNA modification methylase
MPQVISESYELVAVESLRQHPRNVRQADLEAIVASVKANGFYGAVVAQVSTRYILVGNHRWLAAKEAGLEKIPVVWVDVDDDRALRIMLADNQTGDLASNDEAALAELLRELAVTPMELEGTGFTGVDLDAMLEELGLGEPKEGLTEPDAVPVVQPNPITVAGDLWLLGNHRLLCGDSTSAESVERLMAGEKADTLWTDPPYGVSYVGKTKNKLTIKNDGDENLKGLLDGFLACASTVLVPCAPFYIAHPAGSKAIVFGQAVIDAGWRVHQILCWVKDSMVLGHSDYHYKHEPIPYGYTPGEGRPGRGNHSGTRWVGDHAQTSVLEIPRPKRSEEHPTMKPVDLITRCVANNTPAGGLIYDAFSGSGSTLMACEQGGFRCRGMDLDPRYCDVIVRRWQEFTGRDATLDGDTRTFRELAAERVPIKGQSAA